uniref:RNA (guanine-9-)-methyltransferase domain-containing protein 1 n=1 Tax=Daphnia galeata TaxID=27404 RepID=A0A8J2WDP4_9CRUS|nr:unnamed protein product [Daphnia galeata]
MKEERRVKREAELKTLREEKQSKPPSEQHIDYGLGKNTIFLKIYDITMDHYLNDRVAQASMFDLPVVYDHSYEPHMSQQELKNTAKQLALAFSVNREHKNPFPIQFCNVNFNGPVMKHLLKHIPTLYNPEFPINISHKSYLDMFPREKLVYLTPHCRNEMTHFDYDSVYIIGSMVDRGESQPHSLAIAKRENLRMAKLPLDRYLRFGGGSGKSLTLNQMISILLELKTHGDWDKALQAVPKRKLMDPYGNNESPSTMKYPGQRSRDNGNLDELLFSNVPRKMGKSVDKNEKSTTKIPYGELAQSIYQYVVSKTSKARESIKKKIS